MQVEDTARKFSKVNMKPTPTMDRVLKLLASGKNPYHGAKGRLAGARANCLYALQDRGLADNYKGGWKLTPAGRKAVG